MSPPDSLCSSPGSGTRWQLHLHQARSAAAAQRGCRQQPCAECPRGREPVLTAAGATERTWSGVGLKWRGRRGPRADPVSWLELALSRSLTVQPEPECTPHCQLPTPPTHNVTTPSHTHVTERHISLDRRQSLMHHACMILSDSRCWGFAAAHASQVDRHRASNLVRPQPPTQSRTSCFSKPLH